MNVIKPDIRATVRLYSTHEGGRKLPTPSDHLACLFVYENRNFDCRLLLQDLGPLSPGQEAEVPIKFLSPELIKPRLEVGSRFQLRELQVIGSGAVREIVP